MIYKGYTIEPETDPWPIKAGSKVKFYIDGELVYSASDYDEAKDAIDDMIQESFTDEFGCVDHSALNIMERKWKENPNI